MKTFELKENIATATYSAIEHWINESHKGLVVDKLPQTDLAPSPNLRVLNPDSEKGLEIDIFATGSYLPMGVYPEIKRMSSLAKSRGDDLIVLTHSAVSEKLLSYIRDLGTVIFNYNDSEHAVNILEPHLQALENS